MSMELIFGHFSIDSYGGIIFVGEFSFTKSYLTVKLSKISIFSPLEIAFQLETILLIAFDSLLLIYVTHLIFFFRLKVNANI